MRSGRWSRSCARAVVTDGTFQFVRIAAGGIAPVPLRLAAVGSRLARQAGQRGRRSPKRRKQATSGAKPLPMTGYKLDLLEGVVRDLLERVVT